MILIARAIKYNINLYLKKESSVDKMNNNHDFLYNLY